MKKSVFTSTFFKEHAPVISAIFAGIFISIVALINFFGSIGFRSNEAALLLAFENGGQGRMFVGEVVNGMTILDALITSAAAGNIQLKYNINDNGAVVLGLNGYDLNNGKQLAFYLNGHKINESEIHLTRVKPGSKIIVSVE